MTRAAQKDEEIWYLSQFLREELGLNVTDLQPASKEPPDVWATIANGDGAPLLLDVEIAEYYVDDPRDGEGGSPSKRARAGWEKVQAEVAAQLVFLRIPVYIHVRLKEPLGFKTRLIRGLATELTAFAQEFCPERHLARECHDAFSAISYPALHELVESVFLTRLDGMYGIFSDCSNVTAANIGIDVTCLRNRVVLKSGKDFSWRPGAEKWLLLYASGETPTSRAGPRPPDPSIWADKDLIAACDASVFSRIYFWERVRGWHQRLK